MITLATNRGNIYKKMKPKFMPKELKSGPKLGFLSFSQVWFFSFPGNCIG